MRDAVSIFIILLMDEISKHAIIFDQRYYCIYMNFLKNEGGMDYFQIILYDRYNPDN